jgi:hypothetical protein
MIDGKLSVNRLQLPAADVQLSVVNRYLNVLLHTLRDIIKPTVVPEYNIHREVLI